MFGASFHYSANDGYVCSCAVSAVLILWGAAGPILRMGVEFRAKSMLHCYREVKCQLGDTAEFKIRKIFFIR